MLKTIHKYQKSPILYVLMAAVGFAMLGFGVDFLGPDQTGYAVKVDDTEVSYSDFTRQRRNLEDRYRSQYGNLYYQISQQEDWNINQQVLDALIPRILLEKTIHEYNLFAGDSEVRKILLSSFPDKGIYEAYLKQVGMTAKEFQKQLEADAVQAQFAALITDFSYVSKKEALSLLEREETTYAINHVEVDPKTFIEKVEVPADEVLENYFTENLTDYEREERVSYNYVVFDPAKNLNLVDVQPDDIEMYYAEHESNYMSPARAKTRHILLTIPEDSDDAKKEEMKKTAEEVHIKALAGDE